MCVPGIRYALDSDILYSRFHGWAAARGDLKNEENRKECVISCILDHVLTILYRFEDVYGRIIKFFRGTLA